jgi:hypothetical protein
MVSMLGEASMLYLVGRVTETRERPGSYMQSTRLGFDVGYGLPGHVMARGRQMSMGDAGAGGVPVWSRVTTAWSHGGDQTKTEPAPWSMDDHARYRQGMGDLSCGGLWRKRISPRCP